MLARASRQCVCAWRPCRFPTDAVQRAAAAAGAQAGPRWKSGLASRAEEPEESGIHLPEDLELIGRLNPELREAIEQSREYARRLQEQPLRDGLMGLLDSHGIRTRGSLPSLAALQRLPVSELRDVLELHGADNEGPKATLAARLLDLVRAEEEAAQGEEALAQPSTSQLLAPAGRFGRVLKVPRRPPQVPRGLPAFDPDPLDLARVLAAAHAQNVVVLDVKGCCAFGEAMVIGTGRSHHALWAQARAVADWLDRSAAEAGAAPPNVRVEGERGDDWLVVDGGKTIVHCMLAAARAEFDLEGLWAPDGGNLTSVDAPLRSALEAPTTTLDALRLDDGDEDEDEDGDSRR